MKKMFYCIALALCASPLYAQTKVTGAYVDSLSMDAVPFATVALTPEGADKPEQVSLTDLDGKFDVTTKKNGKYLLSISMMGNRPVAQEITAEGKALELGNIWAVEESEKLEGVTVVAVKPIIRSEVDRLAYDVENDPDAPVKTVFDMLKKTPMVTVNAKDEITVNGSSNFTILVNERRSQMFDSEPAKVLKSMPAESVKSIEIITSPGAKYEAQGVGCIINLVMNRKSNMEGILGSVRGEVSTYRKSVGANFTAQSGKFTFSTNAGRNWGNQEIPLTYEEEYPPFGEGKNGAVVNDMSQVNNENGGHLYAEASYEIDTLRLVTANLNLWKGDWSGTVENAQADYFVNNALTNQFAINTKNFSDWGGFGMDLGYERRFGKDKRNTLVFLGNYSQSPSSGSGSANSYMALAGSSVPDRYVDNSSDNTSKTQEFNFQTDFTSQLTAGQRLEAGVKFTLRDNEAKGTTTTGNQLSGKALAGDASDVEQKQGVYAAYLSYTKNWEKFGLKAGVRSETATISVDNKIGYAKGKFDYKNTDVVPSLFLGYNFSPAQSLKLNYVMRINRPGIGYINPLVNEARPGVQQHGNPDLESERYHNLTASYNFYGQRITIVSRANYQFSNNAILSYLYTDKETGINHDTYDNIGLIRNGNIGANLRIALSQRTALNFDGTIAYTNIYASSLNQRAEGFTGNASVRFDCQLPLKINSEIWGAYQGKQIYFQQNQTDAYFYGFTFSRSFYQDRINLSFSGQDPFNKYVDITQNITSDFQRYKMDAKIPIRMFFFNASFRFGKLKAQVRKTSTSINSDDLKNKSNSGGMM